MEFIVKTKPINGEDVDALDVYAALSGSLGNVLVSVEAAQQSKQAVRCPECGEGTISLFDRCDVCGKSAKDG